MPHQVIVGFEPSAPPAVRESLRDRLAVESAEGLGGGNASLYRLPDDVSVAEALQELRASGAVAYAEPNGISELSAQPNDPLFAGGSQWALRNTGQTIFGAGAPTTAGIAGADIGATRAWDVTVGSPTVTIAVIDSGIDLNHGQLSTRLAAVPGWDFTDDDSTPQDIAGHGTSMAGIAAAAGNDGVELTGVAQDVRLMALRASGHDPTKPKQLLNSYIVSAINFAASHGAQIVNMSFEGDFNETIANAIDAAPDTLFVAAAGNTSSGTAAYPCRLPAVNLLCTAATDNQDKLASFSNYEAAAVDIGAPGVGILQTQLGGGTSFGSGTSQATAITSGAAALYRSQYPSATPAEVIERIKQTVDPVPALAGKTVTGGRLDIGDALDFLAPNTTIESGPPSETTSTQASFSFKSSGLGGVFECDLDDGGWQPCSSPTTYSGLALGLHRFSVRAMDGAGNEDPSPARFEWTVVPPSSTGDQPGPTTGASSAGGAGGGSSVPSGSPSLAPLDTAIVKHPPRRTRKRKATFVLAGGVSYRYRVDSGKWVTASSAQVTLRLGPGAHRLSFQAVDAAGGIDPTPAKFRIVITKW